MYVHTHIYMPLLFYLPRLCAKSHKVESQRKLKFKPYFTHLSLSMCVYIYIYTHTHKYMCTHIHTYQHTCVHVRTHACT